MTFHPSASVRLTFFSSLLVAAAATPAAASAAAHGRQRTESGVVGFAAGDGGEHRNGPPGRLFAIGTVSACSAHRLELLEVVSASRTVIFV